MITLRLLACFLFLLFLEVTKLPSLLQLDTLATGLSTSQWATFTTMFAVGIGMVLFCLDFWLYPKVGGLIFNLYFDVLTLSIQLITSHKIISIIKNSVVNCFISLLQIILKPIRPYMTSPKIIYCPDGHYHQAIFSLGPYIADYPKQCLLASIVQGWCSTYAKLYSSCLHTSEGCTLLQIQCTLM